MSPERVRRVKLVFICFEVRLLSSGVNPRQIRLLLNCAPQGGKHKKLRLIIEGLVADDGADLGLVRLRQVELLLGHHQLRVQVVVVGCWLLHTKVTVKGPVKLTSRLCSVMKLWLSLKAFSADLSAVSLSEAKSTSESRLASWAVSGET